MTTVTESETTPSAVSRGFRGHGGVVRQAIRLLGIGVLVATPRLVAGGQARPTPKGVVSQLKSVQLRPVGTSSIQVVFRLSGPISYTLSRSEQPSRITVELV